MKGDLLGPENIPVSTVSCSTKRVVHDVLDWMFDVGDDDCCVSEKTCSRHEEGLMSVSLPANDGKKTKGGIVHFEGLPQVRFSVD